MPDGEGLVSHAGSALLARVADKTGLTRALSLELAGLKQRQSGHDQGRVIRDLAVMLGDGGDSCQTSARSAISSRYSAMSPLLPRRSG